MITTDILQKLPSSRYRAVMSPTPPASPRRTAPVAQVGAAGAINREAGSWPRWEPEGDSSIPGKMNYRNMTRPPKKYL